MSRKSKKSKSLNFRSGFEEDINKILQPHGFTYETDKIDYVVPRVYTPDFTFVGETNIVHVEAKGFFRAGDTQKYKAVVNCLPAFQELVFILMRPNHKINKQTKSTMSEWCEKHKIKWFTLDSLEELVKYVNAG